ncbi:coproporphyrinogen-III oxidase family protein [Iningainema tapete]|uniref:Heme chaperone HemW n=1 Tax=Iningainema tapete BLCC-T55 TaxID=2748662 RepID=A0A8J6XS13_9CYAN|nr:coproporphyrinogen-III oxidase family protein [Iningainema tapete]MBD2777370.1 coproporphyrinogen III oxidase family protein [Iningainema tapete BLCC-T55]
MSLTTELTKLEPKRLPLIPNYPPFRQWKKTTVEEMLGEKPINIYLHIPFCTQRCAFCYYKTVDLKERPEVEGYVATLCKEIEMVAKRFHLSHRQVASIYFGGGTPSLLKEHHFERLVECLHQNFRIENPQFTVEAEPLTVSESKMNTLIKLKVNRLSMGVQSFCDDIIKLSGRGHDEKQAFRAIKIAQQAGDWSINIDLLSGLAGETEETWTRSVECALSTGVESITVYKMEAFSNTEFYKSGVREKTLELPSDEQELKFMQYAMKQFEKVNYLPWSFFTFTKNGHYINQYTKNIFQATDLYGFGASAYGVLGDTLLQNTSDLEKYTATVEAGEIPLARGYRLNSLEQMMREVLLEMKLLCLDLGDFQKRHGFKLESLCAPTLRQLELEGFISVSEKEIKLTSTGILYGDYVGQTLVDCLKKMC